MDSWEKFNGTLLPNKEVLYSKLNLGDNNDKDYNHAQNVWGVSEIRNLDDYHDLYV